MLLDTALCRGLNVLGLPGRARALAQRSDMKRALIEARRKGDALGPILNALEQAISRMPMPEEKAAWNGIERRRAELATRSDTFNDVDYGAGDPLRPYSDEESRQGIVSQLSITDYLSFSKDAAWGQMLFHIARRVRPDFA